MFFYVFVTISRNGENPRQCEKKVRRRSAGMSKIKVLVVNNRSKKINRKYNLKFLFKIDINRNSYQFFLY